MGDQEGGPEKFLRLSQDERSYVIYDVQGVSNKLFWILQKPGGGSSALEFVGEEAIHVSMVQCVAPGVGLAHWCIDIGSRRPILLLSLKLPTWSPQEPQVEKLDKSHP